METVDTSKSFQISNELYEKIKAAYDMATPEEREELIHPDEAKSSAALFLIEGTQKVIKMIAKSTEERRELFINAHDKLISGKNPFKDSYVKKAGINLDTWKDGVKHLRHSVVT